MKLAICPGSFDPITNGHIDLINRAKIIFDKVIVLVLNNCNKKYFFSLDERKKMAEIVTEDMENVVVDKFNGLLIDYAKNVGAIAIVKGIRNILDFNYEVEMSMVNRRFSNDIETIFLNSSECNMHISSSIIKELTYFNCDVSWAVPEKICDKVVSRLKKSNDSL